MFKKTCVQRVSAVIIAMGMVVALTSTSYNMAKASEIEVNEVVKDNALIGFETNANNLVDDYDDDSELCQKLELDYENSTTDLSEEREKELNAIGVFDSDIEAWDDDMIKKINNAYAYSMSVMYYGENPEDGTLEELSQAETDEVIKDVYSEELEETNEEKENIFEQALENTIFGAVKASAKSASKTSKEQSVDSGKVKQILSFIQSSKGSAITVTYSCVWLENPNNKKGDILAVKLYDAKCDTDTIQKYRAWQWNDNTKSTYQTYVEDPTKDDCNGTPEGMYAKFDFYTRNKVFTRNHTFVIKFQCKAKAKEISASGHCFHCKKVLSPSVSAGVSVSIGTGGVSLSVSRGVSIAINEVYAQVTNNPTCDFFPK